MMFYKGVKATQWGKNSLLTNFVEIGYPNAKE